MRRRVRRERKRPEIMLSPMIDMIFLLLVFFIVSTLNMAEVKSIPVRLPVAQTAEHVQRSNFSVTVKKDGALYLDEQRIDLKQLVMQAAAEQKKDERFSVLIRGDGEANYQQVIKLIDELKAAGVTRFGLVTDAEGRHD